MYTRNKQKLKFINGSVSEIALCIIHFQDKAGKKFLKECLVGTLNVCLKLPKICKRLEMNQITLG